MSARPLADRLARYGFRVRLWNDRRIYLAGYGREISAYIEPLAGDDPMLDGARIVVESRWRSSKAALHAKGVKHAILKDLHDAGILSERPPDDWRKIRLDDPRPGRPLAAKSDLEQGRV
ncbi:MAG: hypothetical protein GC204_03775 [Chloroflexi bacterium]|nr:hypothetical protein [Chloroflexota bacterium]